MRRGCARPRPATLFRAYVERFAAPAARDPRRATHAGFVVLRADDDALVGVFNFSEIVRGSFQSAFLGYYAFAPLAGEGYMAEGLSLALGAAFGTLRLHRVEVNVQPGNKRSLAFVRRAGFVREGYSRRYVKIGGRWRDHVRFAHAGRGLARAPPEVAVTRGRRSRLGTCALRALGPRALRRLRASGAGSGRAARGDRRAPRSVPEPRRVRADAAG